MGLSQELAAGIEHPNSRARSRLADIGYIGAEDPGMPRAKAVGAFSGNAYFGLGEGLVQFIMVADSFSNATVSSIVVI